MLVEPAALLWPLVPRPPLPLVGALGLAGLRREGPLHPTFRPAAPADTTPPDTSIDAAPPASTESRSATFTFSSSEAGSSFECKLDSGSWVACDSPQFYSGLSVADHTLLVRATDAAGNVDPNPAVRNWTVEATPPPPPPPPPADTTPPQTSIGSGPAGDTTQRVVSFAFSSSEAGSSFQCKLDSGSWADCDSPQSYSGSPSPITTSR